MMFRVLPEARAELVDAADWYDGRESSLGTRLLVEAEAALATIRNRPLSLSRIEGYSGPLDLRRLSLKEFPYVVYVLCREHEIVVSAISHSRRRPLYWLDRIE